MIFIETSVFTRQIAALMRDEDYGMFQRWLASNPNAGDVIPGTGGIRKVRVAVPGRGKRGGARVIYVHRITESRILLLLAYAKSDQDDLTAEQAQSLRRIIESWS